MITKIIREIRSFFTFLFLASRSRYSLIEKIDVFKVLVISHWIPKIAKTKNQFSIRVFGNKITAFNDWSFNYLFKEIFIDEAYYAEISNANMSIIDCGANIGVAVFYFKRLFPRCTLMAFEPNPQAFELLKKNIEQNDLENISIFNLALSDTTGHRDFFIGKNFADINGSFLENKSQDNRIIVKTDKLSNYMKDKIYDLVKIDVEGAEHTIVKDLIKTNKINCAKRYLIEFHHHKDKEKSNLTPFLRSFEKNNFEHFVKKDLGQVVTSRHAVLDFRMV
ncbi:MAG: FkbM family methyltransferase [Bacteroidota bacterium]